MKAKCPRCARACHTHDKLVHLGIKCCTDCLKEIKSMEAEIVRRVLVSRSLTIKDIVREDPDDVLIYATDGAGLTVSAELVIWDGRELRLALTDETSEGNFAIMFPKKNSARSLQRCMEMSIDEIIEHAEP